jgi:hypothetical protein
MIVNFANGLLRDVAFMVSIDASDADEEHAYSGLVSFHTLTSVLHPQECIPQVFHQCL